MNYWQKRCKAFGYAGAGIARLIKGEAHAKIHLLAAVCVIVAGLLFGINANEWCVIVLCIGGVFAAEGFNTAVEKLADRLTGERDPLIGAAKDIAAGAVLILAIASVVVAALIFMPKIILLIKDF